MFNKEHPHQTHNFCLLPFSGCFKLKVAHPGWRTALSKADFVQMWLVAKDQLVQFSWSYKLSHKLLCKTEYHVHRLQPICTSMKAFKSVWIRPSAKRCKNICLKSAQLTQHRFYQQKYTTVFWYTLTTYSPDIIIIISSIELKRHKTLRYSLVEHMMKRWSNAHNTVQRSHHQRPDLH